MEDNEMKLSKKTKNLADELIKRFQRNDRFLEIVRYFVSIDKDRFIINETLHLSQLDDDFDSTEKVIINKGELNAK